MVIVVPLSALMEVNWVTPGICPNWRSNGAATEAAMVSALAPCNVALTWIVGKSTCGRGATGKNGKATSPTKPIAAISKDVATGRWMKGSEIFMRRDPVWRSQVPRVRSRLQANSVGACIDHQRQRVHFPQDPM